MIGTTVSHYQILEKLGEGGMGVVYKARDTKLDRFVALKFLPSHLAASDADKARFMQEARAASALSHPNVATVYEIDEAEGAMFIAMDFVDGQTLRQRAADQIPNLRSAVEVGIQIADGLAAAHEKGIVHRDIKPENVMIRKDGICQIMDFGLAKLRGNNSKITRLTKEGSTIGTLGYMSPEQVQGHDLDHRSDIFSLGVLLYELFTGQLPFKGVHETALLYEIVNVDPVPVSAVKPEIEGELDRIVLECLQKEPSERYQSVAEVGKDLRRFKRESTRSRATRTIATGQVKKSGTVAQMTSATDRPSRSGFLWPAVAGFLALVVALLIWRPWSDTVPVNRTVMRFPINLPITAPFVQGAATITVAPDGKKIVYLALFNGVPQLFLRPIDQFDAQPIPGTEGANDPFFSPDGEWVAFFANGKLRKVSVFGGAPQDVCDIPGFMRGGWWGRDDYIWYGHINDAIFRVPAAGGKPVSVTVLDSSEHEISHRFPQPLPDGKNVIFTVKASNTSTFDDAIIVVENIETHERRVLVRGGSYARYTGSGHLLYTRSTSIYAVAFDDGRLEVTGAPQPVIEGGMLNQQSGQANFDISATGMLVYIPLGPVSQDIARVVWMDRQGRIQPLLDTTRAFDEVALSPDGGKVAMTVRGANDDIWVYQIARGTLTRLTFGGGNSGRAAWTPDGQRIVYLSERGKSIAVFWKRWDGSGVEERLGDVNDVDLSSSVAFTPDGSVMTYSRGGDIWLMNMNEKRESTPFIQSKAFETGASFSPDGRWMSYFSDESGRFELYIVPFPTRDGKWQVSSEGAGTSKWIRNGNGIIYSDLKKMIEVELTFTPKIEISMPRTICAFPTGTIFPQDISANGTRFIISMARATTSAPTPVNVVVNWFDELRQKFSAQAK